MIVQRTPLAEATPFDLEVVAEHCRAEFPYSAPELERMATAAAAELEAYAQLALLDQTITVTLECGPAKAMFGLPVAPLLDLLSVTVTVDGEAYDAFAVIAGLRPAVHFSSGKPRGLVVIEYVAGFGEAHTDLPQGIANAICDQTAAYFDGRGEGDGKSNGMSPHMARIAARYRRVAI